MLADPSNRLVGGGGEVTSDLLGEGEGENGGRRIIEILSPIRLSIGWHSEMFKMRLRLTS